MSCIAAPVTSEVAADAAIAWIQSGDTLGTALDVGMAGVEQVVVNAQSNAFHVVKLESGDDICFDNGCLGPYTIVSPRFTVGRDCLQGGLRVGQKLDLKKSRGEWVIYQSGSNPNVYYFSPAGDDNVAYVIVDEKGIIQSINKFTNDC